MGLVPSVHDESAPGDLELVRTFINTYDLMPLPGKEELGTPGQLRTWLAQRGLLAADASVDEAGWRRALEVREALRALIASQGDPPAAAAAAALLDAAAARAPLCVHFADGETRLAPTDRGIDGALSRLLAIVHDAMRTGAWQRMKTCGDPACVWAFYDHSKNRSGVWCSMASCGNRNKARRRRAHA
ncbi:MAG TPA: CGNR zinc finger domain-containing protein [Candidatus Sulfotelmatobacter sp.]|nr:CGNR zinc finger domain-containing protein [Candidatus Sulfotelmatobacter sp.]